MREKDDTIDQRQNNLENFNVDDPKVLLSKTGMLSKKEKLAFYTDPNYCFIVKKESLSIMRASLDSLC